MADDVLKTYPEKQVHGWYERLATRVNADAKGQGVSDPMSGLFMSHYLGRNNNNALGDPLELDAPDHLKNDDSVTDVLAFHRALFLTEKKGRFHPGADRWAGLAARGESGSRGGKGDGNSAIALDYTSLSDVAPDPLAIARLYASKPPKKWDIFTSLRGWQLKSSVQLQGTKEKSGLVTVTFVQWTASGEDFYDFDPKEHLTVPNPDYGSQESFAIEPKRKEINVYHTNAIRLENAKLAKPFKVRVRPWIVRDTKLLASATIDPAKRLT